MNVLDILHNELKQATRLQQVTVEYVVQLPNKSEFFGEIYHWIDWSDELGAWVSPDGLNVRVLITEDARDLDPGELTLGFTSTLTGICLNLQGQIAVHANSVILNGSAVAFIGYSGAGKSTLSAFCTSRGARFVTDDVLVINEEGCVLPGNPRIKLYPETGELLGLDASAETDYKIFYHPETHFGGVCQLDPVPLGGLYLLVASEEDQIYIETVPPAQAVFDLLTHGYDVSHFIDKNPRLFDIYIELLNRLPLKRLVYPHDFDRLPELYDLLLKDSQEK
jgi:hypothetical protein